MSDPETRAHLEQERDFLMKSLDDLELEHESGGIDEESYAQLHDDYTARAAGVIRTLRDGVDSLPSTPPRSPRVVRTRIATVAVVVVFAMVAGVSLAYALGARLPGQTSSGNTGSDSATASSTTNPALAALAAKITDLQSKVNASPDDFQLRLDLARAYEENGDISNALKQSDAAISIDPNRAEGHANAARLLYLASEQVATKQARNQLVAQALAGFDQAIRVNPDFADAYYFRAILYAFSTRDNLRSQIDLQNYLVRAPTGQWADQARKLLAQVTAAIDSPSTTVPTSTTKPKRK
ncbi:MAG: tetratricopeptide repeat protein [Acidimicrobiia bacterium]